MACCVELCNQLSICRHYLDHHRLLRFANDATPKLMWWNFVHLFMVSLLPATTAWMAATRLASAPVFVYAAVFVMVNIAFLAFQQEGLSQASDNEVSPTTRRFTRVRALITLGIFAAAAA